MLLRRRGGRGCQITRTAAVIFLIIVIAEPAGNQEGEGREGLR